MEQTAARPKSGRPLQNLQPTTQGGFVAADPSRAFRDGSGIFNGQTESLPDFITGLSDAAQHLWTRKYWRNDTESCEIVRTIVTLAHNLGLDVVAEGMETADHAASLKNFGCQFAQGYYFYKPLDQDAV